MNVRIISHDTRPFADRSEAGEKLGTALGRTLKEKPVVLGIPRGGLVTAQAAAHELDCEMDIILTHKIGAPFNPELAVGAVTEEGGVVLNKPLIDSLNVDDVYIRDETARQRKELERRREMFRRVYPKIPLKGRIVIVTDDGVATGATAQAALLAVAREKPKRLIAAFPVASFEALQKLKTLTDDIICLKLPEGLGSVGQFYHEFAQVSDEEAMEILRHERFRRNNRQEKASVFK